VHVGVYRCVVGVNECDSNPCENGATCYDGYLDYHCACTSEFTGHTCHRRACVFLIVAGLLVPSCSRVNMYRVGHLSFLLVTIERIYKTHL